MLLKKGDILMAETNEKPERTPKSGNGDAVSKTEKKPEPTPKPSNGTIKTFGEVEPHKNKI